MNHFYFYFQTSLTWINGHQLGQWFSTRGNFTSRGTFANVWRPFGFNCGEYVWQVETQDAAKYAPMHKIALKTKNNLVQCATLGEAEKSRVKTKWDQWTQGIISVFVLTDKVSVVETTDTLHLTSAEHSIFIYLPKTTLHNLIPHLFHKLLSLYSFSNLDPRWR